MTGKEAYRDVVDFCGELEKAWSRIDMDPQQKGVLRGIKIVKDEVRRRLENLPEEEA